MNLTWRRCAATYFGSGRYTGQRRRMTCQKITVMGTGVGPD
jgi:hypothetical protein